MMMLFLVSLVLVNADISADEIKVLPGWESALPSKHYSGLISVGSQTGTTGKLHYWFVESENNPASDPVVLWLNGGPGSSSLIGCLTENGQFSLNDDSMTNKTKQGVPRLWYNPYSWTKHANVIWLESPKGVGFSFCDNPNNCHNTDETTAIDAHEFLVNFFKGFSEYANSDFYITGESYAGVYIPMLIDQIDKQKVITTFKGAAIGNGCWGSDCFYGVTEDQIDSHIFSGHSLISQTLEADITSHCEPNNWHTQSCRTSLAKMDDQAGQFDVYNIYDVCKNDDKLPMSKLRAILRNNTTVLEKPLDSYHPHPQLRQLNDYKCGGSNAMDAFLSNSDVVKALHVKSGTGRMHYSADVGDLRDLYKSLFQKHRIVIYSGDADACVPHWGSEKWTREMGFSVTKDWHPWLSDSVEKKGEVVAGYAIEYKSLTYVTIKGAGHMVPQFKPAFALTMFKKFLDNSPF